MATIRYVCKSVSSQMLPVFDPAAGAQVETATHTAMLQRADAEGPALTIVQTGGAPTYSLGRSYDLTIDVVPHVGSEA